MPKSPLFLEGCRSGNKEVNMNFNSSRMLKENHSIHNFKLCILLYLVSFYIKAFVTYELLVLLTWFNFHYIHHKKYIQYNIPLPTEYPNRSSSQHLPPSTIQSFIKNNVYNIGLGTFRASL